MGTRAKIEKCGCKLWLCILSDQPKSQNKGLKNGHKIQFKMHHTEQLHDLYMLLSIVRIVKSMRLCWAGNSSESEDSKSSKDHDKKISRKV